MDVLKDQTSEGKWMKLAQASYHLGISEVTLRRKIKNKQLPARVFEGRYFIWVPAHQIKLTPTVSPTPPLAAYEKEIKKLKRHLSDQNALIELLEKENQRLKEWIHNFQKHPKT